MPNLQYIKCRQLRLDSYLLHIPFKMYLSPLDKKLPACNDIDISRINKVKNHAPCSIISEININTWRKEVLSREIFFNKAGSWQSKWLMISSSCTKSFLLPKIYCSSSNCIWPEVQRGRPALTTSLYYYWWILHRDACSKGGNQFLFTVIFAIFREVAYYCHWVRLKLGWVSATLCSERCVDEDESCYVVLVCWYPQRGVSREQSKKLTFGLLLWTTDTTEHTAPHAARRWCHPATNE